MGYLKILFNILIENSLFVSAHIQVSDRQTLILDPHYFGSAPPHTNWFLFLLLHEAGMHQNGKRKRKFCSFLFLRTRFCFGKDHKKINMTRGMDSGGITLNFVRIRRCAHKLLMSLSKYVCHIRVVLVTWPDSYSRRIAAYKTLLNSRVCSTVGLEKLLDNALFMLSGPLFQTISLRKVNT